MKMLLFMAVLCVAVISCTKGKTDYKAEIDTVVTEHLEFKEATSVTSNGYHISIEALNGTFYKGYNEIRLKITNGQTGESVKTSTVTFLPIMTNAEGEQVSCPHRYQLIDKADERYFAGYAVFTDQSSLSGSWDLYLTFIISGQTYQVKKSLTVQEQPNKNLNMTMFMGKDNEQYIIALISPQKPKVAENELLAGIYKYQRPMGNASGVFPDPTQFSYAELSGYTLLLDPRMPEPSMGNHSSPNNKDLREQQDGLYHGVVNYTMTGNWTLNFIMQNERGQIIKGTAVPDDFTPGIAGAKSDLHIDILF